MSLGVDDSLFREIVDRYGPTVLRTCQRILLDKHEAEDAFQATFLILARRLEELRGPESLGGWLVGVARRVALRARSRSVRQTIREKRWASTKPTSLQDQSPLDEIRQAVREELEQLPSKYRRPLSLCYLEGMTHEAAAAQLQCPVGTVKVQLVRARKLLKERLDRRGVALGVAFLLFLLRGGSEAEGACLPLAESTVKAMTIAAQGKMAALQTLYPRATSLAQQSLAPFFLSLRLARFLLILAVIGVASGGITLATQVKIARDNASSASVRLSKVLDVNCR